MTLLFKNIYILLTPSIIFIEQTLGCQVVKTSRDSLVMIIKNAHDSQFLLSNQLCSSN